MRSFLGEPVVLTSHEFNALYLLYGSGWDKNLPHEDIYIKVRNNMQILSSWQHRATRNKAIAAEKAKKQE